MVRSSLNNKERKHWIDSLRGICMIAILLDHTELYYTGINIINYNAYVVNALVLFFFLSGYLIYKEKGLNFPQKLKSIGKTLLLPYVLFSFLLSFPKALVYGYKIELSSIISQIVYGQSSWFVAALCLSEFIFTLAVWATRGRIIPITILAILGFGASIYLSKGNQPYIWQIDNSLQALLFLCAGYAYHRYEQVFHPLNRPQYTCFLFLLLIIIKVYEYKNGVNMLIWYIHINNYPIFLTDILISSLFMVQISKALPTCKWLEWTGAHSLVYYFLCGGIPMLVAKIFKKVGWNYEGNYLPIFAVFVCVYITTTLLAWLIYKYVPFIVGKKYETNK